MTLSIELDEQQLEIVTAGLGELPLKIANGVFVSIMRQVSAQKAKAAADENTASDLVEKARVGRKTHPERKR